MVKGGGDNWNVVGADEELQCPSVRMDRTTFGFFMRMIWAFLGLWVRDGSEFVSVKLE